MHLFGYFFSDLEGNPEDLPRVGATAIEVTLIAIGADETPYRVGSSMKKIGELFQCVPRFREFDLQLIGQGNDSGLHGAGWVSLFHSLRMSFLGCWLLSFRLAARPSGRSRFCSLALKIDAEWGR